MAIDYHLVNYFSPFFLTYKKDYIWHDTRPKGGQYAEHS